MSFQIHHDSSHKNLAANKFGFKLENSKILVTKNQNDSKIAVKRVPLQASNFCPNNYVKVQKKVTCNNKIETQVQIYNKPPEIKEQNKAKNVQEKFKVLELDEIPSFNHITSNKENVDIIQDNQNSFYLTGDQHYLMTSEYHDSIYAYLLKLERKLRRPKVDYMTKQPELSFKMRSVLVDWLAAVADEYSMQPQTLHLAVQYIDCFLSRMSVIKNKFQLVGTAAMMIAAKFEEIYPPDIKEWSYLTADAFSPKQLLKMEQLILKVLNFETTQPTPCTFVAHICFVCNLPKKVMLLALYLTELSLLEGEDYFEYFPSQLAFAAVALARHTLNEKELWPKYFQTKTGYSLKQLNHLIKRQHKSFKDSPTKAHQAIQDKFKTVKFGRVSLFTPKELDLSVLEQ